LKNAQHSTRDDCYDAISLFARQQNFAVSKIKTSERQLWVGCVHAGHYCNTHGFTVEERQRLRPSIKTQCPFIAKAKPVKGRWIVNSVNNVHNHPFARPSTFYHPNRKMNAEAEELTLTLVKVKAKDQLICDFF
jgi:hypothetical protein